FLLVVTHVVVVSDPGVAAVANLKDEFNSQEYDNNDGSQLWLGDWQEVGESTDPTSGVWQVAQDGAFPGYSLQKTGSKDYGIQRQANLQGFSSASLNFDYRRQGLTPAHSVEVQVSASGFVGPWTTVSTIDGGPGLATDPAYVSRSVDIAAYISSATAIRFYHPTTSGAFGTPKALFLDNIEIVGNTTTNQAPVLGTVGGQSGVEGSLIGFTATGSDPDVGDLLTFSLAGVVPAGASITAGGVFTWTPTETQGPGVYAFDVVVTDDGTPNLDASETVGVTVTETNTAPVAVDPGDQADAEGDSVSVFVAASDVDLPADTLTWSASGLPNGLSIDAGTGEILGTVGSSASAGSVYSVIVTVADDGSPGLQDQVGFDWTITATETETNTAPTGTDQPPVPIAKVNAAPVGVNDQYAVVQGQTLTVAAPGVLGNDSDIDGDTLTATLLGLPSHGTVELATDGSFTYIHTGADASNDAFWYQVSDGNGGLATAVVTIVVKERNHDPVAVPDVIYLTEDGSVTFDPLSNDFDPNDDALTIVIVEQPSVGVITVQAGGRYDYEPPPNFAGIASATYTITDGRGGADSAGISFLVSGVDDPPIGGPDDIVLSSYLTQVILVLAKDTDADGDVLKIGSVEQPQDGEVTFDSSTVEFTPQSGWVGSTSFRYTVVDPSGASDEVTVTVTLPRQALAAAKRLSSDLGTESLNADSVPPNFSTKAVVVTAMQSIKLFTRAFFQTVAAFQIPAALIGLTFLIFMGMGGATSVPMILAGRHRRYWSIVMLSRETQLPVYTEPGGTSTVIYNFNPATEGILSTGRPVNAEDSQWIPVETTRSDGWVNGEHLTEQMDAE
ncbi:MAG: Ig-like domain-containing protein, partial [Acidimicrobiia bacterium]